MKNRRNFEALLKKEGLGLVRDREVIPEVNELRQVLDQVPGDSPEEKFAYIFHKCGFSERQIATLGEHCSNDTKVHRLLQLVKAKLSEMKQ